MYNFVRLTELYYVGSHGMDIKGPTTTSKYNKVSELDVVHVRVIYYMVAYINSYILSFPNFMRTHNFALVVVYIG